MVKTKIFLISFIFLFSSVTSQQIKITESGNAVKDAENIISQEKNFRHDTIALKKYLSPLLKIKNAYHRVIYYGLLANGYRNYFEKDNKKSSDNFLLSISLAKKTQHESIIIWSQLNYVAYRYNYSQFTKMLPLFVASIKQIEKLKDSEIIQPFESYKQIAWILQTIGANDDAIIYFSKINKNLPYFSSQKAGILDNLALCYFQKKDFHKSMQLVTEANKIAYKINDSLRIAKTYGNIGNLFLFKKDYKKALFYLKKDIAISEKLNNEKNSMFAYQLLARTYIEVHQLHEAMIYLDRAEKIAVANDYFKSEERDILSLKLSILEDGNQSELALRKRIAKLENFSKNNDGEQVVNTAQLLVQKAKYEGQIDQVNTDLEKASFQKKFMIGFLILFLITLIFILRFFYIKLKNKKIQNEENMINSEIEKQNYERKILETEEILNAQISLLKEKNKSITSVNKEIRLLRKDEFVIEQEKHDELEEILKSHLMSDENWLNFKNAFEKKYPDFFHDLNAHFPKLTITNMKVILLHKLNFNNTEIAGLLGVSADAVKKSKQRLRKKVVEKNDIYEELIVPFFKK